MNQLESAVLALVGGSRPAPAIYYVGSESRIVLAEGSGHLLDGATVTGWVEQ